LFPAPGTVKPFRNLHTNRTPWNFESWNLAMAAVQAAAVL
jgi:hypothetical protein